MKKDLPYVLFLVTVVAIGVVLVISMTNFSLALGSLAFGIVLSPIIILALVIHKFYTKSKGDKYFYFTLVLNIIIILLSVYSLMHALDNFMSLS